MKFIFDKKKNKWQSLVLVPVQDYKHGKRPSNLCVIHQNKPKEKLMADSKKTAEDQHTMTESSASIRADALRPDRTSSCRRANWCMAQSVWMSDMLVRSGLSCSVSRTTGDGIRRGVHEYVCQPIKGTVYQNTQKLFRDNCAGMARCTPTFCVTVTETYFCFVIKLSFPPFSFEDTEVAQMIFRLLHLQENIPVCVMYSQWNHQYNASIAAKYIYSFVQMWSFIPPIREPAHISHSVQLWQHCNVLITARFLQKPQTAWSS